MSQSQQICYVPHVGLSTRVEKEHELCMREVLAFSIRKDGDVAG